MINLPYEIQELTGETGELRLNLIVEGKRLSGVVVDVEVLDAMDSHLGITREALTAELRTSLENLLKDQLEKVAVSEPVEDPDRPLRFHARYTYRDHDNVDTGLVWYDVETSSTGPEELPPIVLNKMRHEVHRLLTSDGGVARSLVDLHG